MTAISYLAARVFRGNVVRARSIVGLLLAVLVAISGCARYRIVSTDVPELLPKSWGYALFEIDSDTRILELAFGGVTLGPIHPGREFVILAVPRQLVRVRRVTFDSGAGGRWPAMYILPDKHALALRVWPGAINYGGQLRLRMHESKLRYRAINRSSRALRFLAEHYPALLASHPVRYTGRIRDDFLELAGEAYARNPSSLNRKEPDGPTGSAGFEGFDFDELSDGEPE
jgi:hypothetical protein